jgi:AraC-like DNA-binding protein
MGIAYERSVGFYKDFHTHDRPMIVLPRGPCAVRVCEVGGAGTWDIDSAGALLVPSGVSHEDECLTAIFDTVALYPSAALLDRVVEDEGFAAARVRRLFARCRPLARSRWLEQLMHEYFFARVVSRRESAQTVAFFERQILVELLGGAFGLRRRAPADPADPADPATVGGENVTSRALRYIESNLFSKITPGEICRHAFASPSTLLRQFRHDTGTRPLRLHQAAAARGGSPPDRGRDPRGRRGRGPGGLRELRLVQHGVQEAVRSAALVVPAWGRAPAPRSPDLTGRVGQSLPCSKDRDLVDGIAEHGRGR